MTQPYECEVRFGIDNIEDFQARLHNLGAKIAIPYEFIDHYYKPPAGHWDPIEKNVRIRQWIQPQKESTVYFVKLEIVTIEELQFKRSLYPEGKLPLFTGTIETCRMLLDDLGFEFWFSLRKEKACLWEVPQHDFFTAVEHIEGLGWTAELEFEGQDPHKAASAIRQALDVLKIPPQKVTHNPISAIYLPNKKCSKNVKEVG
jgi:adenylate cyclase class IV